MFKTRLLSGILLVIIALVTVITGGNLLFAVLLLISLIGMTELYKVFHIEKKAPGIVGYIFAILYYGLLYFKPLLPGESLNWFVMLFMAFLICQMAVLVFAYPKYNTQQIFAGFFGMFYVAVMLSYIYQTRNLPGGIFSVWLVFVCSWGCDTCAYCVGMLIGKHKLAPILSPKKSIEGGIGGIVGSALLGAAYGAVGERIGLMDLQLITGEMRRQIYYNMRSLVQSVEQFHRSGTWQLLQSSDITILKIMAN